METQTCLNLYIVLSCHDVSLHDGRRWNIENVVPTVACHCLLCREVDWFLCVHLSSLTIKFPPQFTTSADDTFVFRVAPLMAFALQ